jgi:hypothetical protein
MRNRTFAGRGMIVCCLTLLAGCASTAPETAPIATAPTGPPPAALREPEKTRPPAADAAAAATKVAAAERSLALARAKLDKSRADLANQEASGRESVAAAEADLALAARGLANFATTSKLRLEREKTTLQGATDNVAEAEEEMQQLLLMYEQTELADKTKELVIRRGQRRLERSKRSLELQQQALVNLEEIDLAHERARLQLDVDGKTRALARAKREAAASLADKTLAVQAQENEVQKLDDELAAARRAASPAETEPAPAQAGSSKAP